MLVLNPGKVMIKAEKSKVTWLSLRETPEYQENALTPSFL